MHTGAHEMAQPTILLANDDVHLDMDLVLDAMGRGDKTFEWGRKIVASGTTSPIIYRLALDMGADATYATALRAMAEAQTLPSISGTWGSGGVISAAEAQTAMLGFQAFTAAGSDINGLSWVNTVLTGMGLAFKPDED